MVVEGDGGGWWWMMVDSMMVVDDGNCHHRRVKLWACHTAGYMGALLIFLVVLE